MTVTGGAKSGQAEKVAKAQQTPVQCAEERASPESQQERKVCEISPCKAKFQIYGDATVLLPKHKQVDEAEMNKDICVENKSNKAKQPKQPKQNCTQEPGQCPFLSNGNHPAPKARPNQRCKKQAGGKLNGRSQPAPPTETRPPPIISPSSDFSPENGLLSSPPGPRLSGAPSAVPAHRTVAPLWSRSRLLTAARTDSLPRRSDIEGATCATDLGPEAWMAPPPIDQRRRSQLFTALRNANRVRNDSGDRAVEEAVRAVLYREHPELIVQRFCRPPDSLCGTISAEEFILHGTRPVHVHDDLFLGPATLSREQMISLIRAGQYHHGRIVACFYAYLYCYEFVFFCEYLRNVKCRTPEARAVLRGVLLRAQNLHLISHSATIFSLAPETMFPQRSSFLYVARLFPMQEPWEVDLLCGMVNSRDVVADAALGWNRNEHVLFTMHHDMLRQSRLQGRPKPPFHPAVTRLPSSADAFSNIEGEQVQRLDSHGLVVFKERGASYMDVEALCRFAPLGELSTEEVLRRSVGRHALIHLFGDVFFLGAPPVDLHRGEIRYLRPAEVRLHVQVGFYFQSPSYVNFVWNAQQSVNRGLRDACRLRAPQLYSEEVALVRWVLQHWVDTSRRGVFRSACELARFGPYLLNEYGKMLWRVLCGNNFECGALELCTDLTEHARAMLETALAEHNCLAGN